MARRSADDVRARAVDGAASCFRDLGVANTSVADIVHASGIARSTLYRHVGDRNDLLLAVTLDEIDRLHTDLGERLAESTSVEDVLVDGVLHVVDLVRESVVLYDLVSNPSMLAVEVSDRAVDALVTRLREIVEPFLAMHDDGIRPGLDPTIAVECLVRTITSLATFQVRSDRTRQEQRRYLAHTLVPIFVTDRVASRVLDEI